MKWKAHLQEVRYKTILNKCITWSKTIDTLQESVYIPWWKLLNTRVNPRAYPIIPEGVYNRSIKVLHTGYLSYTIVLSNLEVTTHDNLTKQERWLAFIIYNT